MRCPRARLYLTKDFHLQRNKFTRSFSLEAIQKTLVWRLSNLWPTELPSRIPNVHCLPTDIRDRFGRAVLVIQTTPMDKTVDSQKRSIVLAFEQLRIHLRRLYDGSEDHRNPPLQYMVLLDLSQLSLQSLVSTRFTHCKGILFTLPFLEIIRILTFSLGRSAKLYHVFPACLLVVSLLICYSKTHA